MIKLPRRVQKPGGDVIGLEVRVVGEDLLACLARGEQSEHIDDTNSHPSVAGPPPALLRVDRDSIKEIRLPH